MIRSMHICMCINNTHVVLCSLEVPQGGSEISCVPCHCSDEESCCKSEDLVLMEPLVLRRDASVSRILSPIMTPYDGG